MVCSYLTLLAFYPKGNLHLQVRTSYLRRKMSFEYVRELPSVNVIKQEHALTAGMALIKKKRDEDISAVLTGSSDKFLIIVGPCSADNEAAVLDYNRRLKTLQDRVAEKLILIPRIYTNKPRTTGAGYKGMAHQPDPAENDNIVEGLRAIRSLHIKSLSETGLTAADEMLYPTNYPYLDDLLSYVAVGARSVENQHHRLTISGLDIAVGMKNPTSGDITVLLNSITAAQMSHTFVYNGWEVKTSGNTLCHAVLRGAVNAYGRCLPNYHYEDLMRLAQMYSDSGLENPAIIVDTNHSNSDKMFKEQPRIAMEVLDNMSRSGTISKMVKGLMIESYIEEGAQKIDQGVYGKSITDPCLSWNDTERLLLDIADQL